jgi:hypothetical protein
MRLGIMDLLIAPDVAAGRLRRAPHVLAAKQDDEVVLCDTARGRYYTLNAVGARVWELLAAPTSLDELVAVVRREFALAPDVTNDPVAGDVSRLLHALHAARILIVEHRGG